MPSLSIVVPAYNEAANVVPAIEEIAAVAQSLKVDYEIILVNDGSRDATGEVLILLQSNKERAQSHCLSVVEAGRVGHPLAMREEHYDILVCRGLRTPLRQVWPTLKKWR